MNSMDDVLDYVQQIDPLWSVVLVALALAVLVVAKLWRTSFLRILAGTLTVVIVGAIAGGGYYGYLHFEDLRRLDERRALDERADALFSKTIETDSVFACIDGSAAPAMLEACERSLFAEPPRVAAAVAIVTQRLAFLGDALAFATARDPDYAKRIESMRTAVETDPYGFVAFVMSVEHRCTPESCARFSLLRDPARVKENMRVRRLEAYMAKHATAWRGSSELPEDPTPTVGGQTTSPLVTISGESRAVPAGKDAPSTADSKESAVAEPSAATSAADPPIAAMAPIIIPPSDAGFAEPQRTAAPVATTPAPAKGVAAAAPAAKGAAAPDKGAPRPATQAKAKAKAIDPAARRSSEPVAGLPRVVPSEYIREQEEKEAASAQSSTPQPGAPTPITPPQQNFIAR